MPTVRLINNTGMHRVRRVCMVVLRAHEQVTNTPKPSCGKLKGMLKIASHEHTLQATSKLKGQLH